MHLFQEKRFKHCKRINNKLNKTTTKTKALSETTDGAFLML